MKVHNYGSDYTFQLHQKKEADRIKNQPIVESEITAVEDVENQLQGGGETVVATTDNEANCNSETEKSPETKKRKKKEKAIDRQ